MLKTEVIYHMKRKALYEFKAKTVSITVIHEDSEFKKRINGIYPSNKTFGYKVCF
jgi:hypothetical protein